MEEGKAAVNKGYQKQIAREPEEWQPKPRAQGGTDYASPTARNWPALLDAIERGDAERVRQLIDEGVNVNVLRDGATPLMIAASTGIPGTAEVILQAGVNINERTDDGWTALHRAAADQTGSAIVDLLLQYGIMADARTKSGKTALQMAEEKAHRDIVRTIQQHQARQQADAREWEEFLRSADGRPYREQGRIESLGTLFRLSWVPAAALPFLGLLVGILTGAVVSAFLTGIVTGAVISVGIFLWERRLRTYLDEIGPLPPLDIHLLREKRTAGEPVLAPRGSRRTTGEAPVPPPAGEPGPQIIVPGHGTGPGPEDLCVSVPSATGAPVWRKRLLLFTVAVAAAVIVTVGALLFLYGDALAAWWYAKKLERSGIPVTEQAFLDAVSKNSEASIVLFFKAGMNAAARDDRGRTALMIAAEEGHAGLIAVLARQAPSVVNATDREGNTALMTACRLGREQVVKRLVEHGANVNTLAPSQDRAATALQAAADAPELRDEHHRILRYLLEHGADVNGRNAAGRTPLLFAVSRDRPVIAAELIDKGADVNAVDRDGTFPLLDAACRGNAALVTLLADKGADLHKSRADGFMPLLCAVEAENIATAALLLTRGAPVNGRTSDGTTALASACRAASVDIVKLLLAHGADPAGGCLPEAFPSFRGRQLSVSMRNAALSDALARIARTAAQDGYAVRLEGKVDRKVTLKSKASWNRVLMDVASRNNLLLVVRAKDVYALPFDPAGIRKGAD